MLGLVKYEFYTILSLKHIQVRKKFYSMHKCALVEMYKSKPKKISL